MLEWLLASYSNVVDIRNFRTFSGYFGLAISCPLDQNTCDLGQAVSLGLKILTLVSYNYYITGVTIIFSQVAYIKA